MGPLDEQPVPKAPEDNVWTFVYKKGPAPMNGAVRARGMEEAYRIACKWCEVQGFRSPARVMPWIVADVTIFGDMANPVIPVVEPGAIGSTSRASGKGLI